VVDIPAVKHNSDTRSTPPMANKACPVKQSSRRRVDSPVSTNNRFDDSPLVRKRKRSPSAEASSANNLTMEDGHEQGDSDHELRALLHGMKAAIANEAVELQDTKRLEVNLGYDTLLLPC
jgi:hypothetical protein